MIDDVVPSSMTLSSVRLLVLFSHLYSRPPSHSYTHCILEYKTKEIWNVSIKLHSYCHKNVRLSGKKMRLQQHKTGKECDCLLQTGEQEAMQNMQNWVISRSCGTSWSRLFPVLFWNLFSTRLLLILLPVFMPPPNCVYVSPSFLLLSLCIFSWPFPLWVTRD